MLFFALQQAATVELWCCRLGYPIDKARLQPEARTKEPNANVSHAGRTPCLDDACFV